ASPTRASWRSSAPTSSRRRTMEQVRLIEAGVAVDDRGQLAFVNTFGFEGVKRFYAVSNHGSGFVRAWHAQRKQAKYVQLARGRRGSPAGPVAPPRRLCLLRLGRRALPAGRLGGVGWQASPGQGHWLSTSRVLVLGGTGMVGAKGADVLSRDPKMTLTVTARRE